MVGRIPEKLKKGVALLEKMENHGSYWGFSGKVLEISESGGMTVARVGTGSWGLNAVWVTGQFSTEFLENDRVYVVGSVTDDYTYTSQAGWTITIPAVTATGMIKPGEADKIRASGRKNPKIWRIQH
jgi:hypothetical protein